VPNDATCIILSKSLTINSVVRNVRLQVEVTELHENVVCLAAFEGVVELNNVWVFDPALDSDFSFYLLRPLIFRHYLAGHFSTISVLRLVNLAVRAFPDLF